MKMNNNSQAGFSLLETMVAVAISATVLLMAAAAVRGATQSMRKMETIAEENHLLVRGWITAMNDVDYWHSHANPDFPYLAGPMGESFHLTIDSVDTYDHPWDKRPFKPITFTDELNPNLLLPHDPRSWYRGGSLVNLPPVARTAPTYSQRFVWHSSEDAIVGTKSRLSGSEVREDLNWVHFPAGWAPRAMAGNYSAITRALAAGDGSTEYSDAVTADLTNATNMGVARSTTDFMPTVQWWLFSELGHTGAGAYLPPGALNMIYRPDTNRTVANIGNAATFYDWGEVPWSLASGSKLDPTVQFAPEAFLVPDTSDFPAGSMNSIIRRNMLPGFPGSGRALDEVYIQSWDGRWGTTSSRYGNNRGTSNNVYAVDYETVMSRHRATTVSGGGGSYLATAGFYPGRVSRIGNDFDTKSLLDRTIIDPLRLLSDDDGTTNNIHSRLQSVSNDRMERRFQMITQHQPATATNDDRLLSTFGDSLQMQHRISRYRAQYRDVNKIMVTVVNPENGVRIDLSARVTGTNWKGARQHWGWKSQQSGWTHGLMGDQYAP